MSKARLNNSASNMQSNCCEREISLRLRRQSEWCSIHSYRGSLPLQKECNGARNTLFERNHGFGRGNTGDFLNLIIKQILQMFVVAGIEFNQDRVGACGEVALHNLGNVDELVDCLLVHRATFELDTDVSAGTEAQKLRADLITTSGDDAFLNHARHTLMDGSAGHTAMGSNFLETPTCVNRDDSKDFTIQ